MHDIRDQRERHGKDREEDDRDGDDFELAMRIGLCAAKIALIQPKYPGNPIRGVSARSKSHSPSQFLCRLRT